MKASHPHYLTTMKRGIYLQLLYSILLLGTTGACNPSDSVKGKRPQGDKREKVETKTKKEEDIPPPKKEEDRTPKKKKKKPKEHKEMSIISVPGLGGQIEDFQALNHWREVYNPKHQFLGLSESTLAPISQQSVSLVKKIKDLIAKKPNVEIAIQGCSMGGTVILNALDQLTDQELSHIHHVVLIASLINTEIFSIKEFLYENEYVKVLRTKKESLAQKEIKKPLIYGSSEYQRQVARIQKSNKRIKYAAKAFGFLKHFLDTDIKQLVVDIIDFNGKGDQVLNSIATQGVKVIIFRRTNDKEVTFSAQRCNIKHPNIIQHDRFKGHQSAIAGAIYTQIAEVLVKE